MDVLRVGVIFGGRSVEHEVSIVTAHQAMEALQASSHEVVPIYITREGRWLTSPELFDLDVYRRKRWDTVGEEAFIAPVTGLGGIFVPGGLFRGNKSLTLDVVIPAVHGTFGEDGTLQGLLELAGIPYTGSGVVGSAVGMDKPAMKAAFQAAGLPVLPHRLVDVHEFLDDRDTVVKEVEVTIGYPAFVKPAHLGSSVGIGKAKDRDGLIEALEVARRYDYRVLVEPSAEDCIEVNCAVLGGHGSEPQASVCEQPIVTEEVLSFSDKYMRGKSGKRTSSMADQDRRIPAPIGEEMTEQVQRNAIGAFTAVDAAGVGRVDSFVKETTGETWVMEINTVPGSFSFYLWERSGVDFPELMQRLIDIALAGHKERSELLFTYDSGMLERSFKGVKRGE